jgi:5-(carboxyamino)imidazole ribonucleotide mutase
MEKVTIIMGSESDKHIADKVVEVLEQHDVEYKLYAASAHREPEKVREIVNNSPASVFICIAGLSAALPGVVASLTYKPVIGVPVGVKLGGLDALLSISQMPPGVPVAAVGIDNGKNAAHLAIRILGVSPKSELVVPIHESSSPAPSGTASFFQSIPMVGEEKEEPKPEPKKDRPTGDWGA